MYPRGQRHTAVSPPVVRHLPPWEQGTLLHLSAVHSSATTINRTDQWIERIERVNGDVFDSVESRIVKYHGTVREIFSIKIKRECVCRCVHRAVEKYQPVSIFRLSLLACSMAYSIVGVNIWRKYSFALSLSLSSALPIVPSRSISFSVCSDGGGDRKLARCLRNYLPPRSFADSIGNFRRMKERLSLSLLPSFLSLSLALFFPLFFFFFPFGGWVAASGSKAEDSWKIDATLVDFSIGETRKYWWRPLSLSSSLSLSICLSTYPWHDFNRGQVLLRFCSPRSRVPQFANE